MSTRARTAECEAITGARDSASTSAVAASDSCETSRITPRSLRRGTSARPSGERPPQSVAPSPFFGSGREESA